MPIQILGIRKFFSKEEQKEIVFDAFLAKKWRAPSVQDLFKNIEKYLKAIPKKEQWNLYFTCADCLEEKGRKMVSQQIIPFDIDGIDVDRRKDYIPIVCGVLGVEPGNMGILFSGNGLQFFIMLTEPFTSVNYFKANKVYYQDVCAKVDAALAAAQLPGHMDPTVFSPARIMRLPLTLNIKPNKPERMGELYYRDLVPVVFDLASFAGLHEIETKEPTPSNYPPPDTKAVLSGCEFLKWCADKPQDVSENLWYAMLSITARLDDGDKLSHKLSEGHPGYNVGECDAKIKQALESSGPRTCDNIEKIWGKCSTCKFQGKQTSPILIRGENYIRTQANGFHDWAVDKDGNRKPGKPNYEDLRRYFEQKHSYITLIGTRLCYVWNGVHWELMPDGELEKFAYDHFRPFVMGHARKEFRELITITNTRDVEWFNNQSYKKINFLNGVLDLNNLAAGLQPHNKEFGCRYVLPYNFDPNAGAPRFEQFLKEVTQDDTDLQNLLLEFAGYCFSNDECWTAKAMILTGDGANGKSTFLNVLFDLAGAGNYSVLTLDSLRSETSRQSMDGKLFNASEETPTYSLIDAAAFKNFVSGGTVQMRQLYKSAYTVRNRTKFIFACNELPINKDMSQGMFRRLLIVPFEKVFDGEARDTRLHEKLVAELPGIFNLVLEGYKRLVRQRGFTASEKVDRQVTSYKQDSDIVEVFVSEMVTCNGMDPSEQSRLPNMYSNFKFFAEQRGFRPPHYNHFCRQLRRIMPDFDKRHLRKRFDGHFEGVLIGVKYSEMSSS